MRGTDDMNRRQNRRKVLDLEVQRWSSVPCNRLLYELSDVKVYEVEYGSKTYQVEVEILENTAKYVRQSTGIHLPGDAQLHLPEARAAMVTGLDTLQTEPAGACSNTVWPG